MAAATLSQMLRQPFVRGVFSRVRPAGTAFQQAYNMGATSIATEPSSVSRTLVYDIFDHTRTMASARAPDIGPGRVAAKAIGQANATALRLYESIPFPISKIAGTRGLGQFGSLDAQGQGWVIRQQRFLAERFANAIEFMVSRMFRGGFSIQIDGDNYYLRESGAGSVDVDFKIPSGNKGQIGGVISATWSTIGTKILDHMLDLNKLSQVTTGNEIRHCWINSTTYSKMLANTQLQTVRGTANRAFEQFVPSLVDTTTEQRNIGFTVIFPSMPQFIWHIYDGSSVVATNVDPSTHTTGNNSLYIPDNIAIFTPEPDLGGWHGMFHSGEYIRENDESEYQYKSGLSTWSKRMNDPPGEELRALHNLTPLLYIPNSVYYATVIF